MAFRVVNDRRGAPLVVGSDQPLVENLIIIGNRETHPLTWLYSLNLHCQKQWPKKIVKNMAQKITYSSIGQNGHLPLSLKLSSKMPLF